jgi:hypothetical protein
MKITVDVAEKDLKDILKFSKERKKGPAIAKLLTSALMLRRREEFCDQVMKGEIRIDFPEWETARHAERKANVWIN